VKKTEYDSITSPDILRALVHKFQQDALDLNDEVRVAKQENILLKKRIKKLRALYHLRFKQDIDEILKS